MQYHMLVPQYNDVDVQKLALQPQCVLNKISTTGHNSGAHLTMRSSHSDVLPQRTGIGVGGNLRARSIAALHPNKCVVAM